MVAARLDRIKYDGFTRNATGVLKQNFLSVLHDASTPGASSREQTRLFLRSI